MTRHILLLAIIPIAPDAAVLKTTAGVDFGNVNSVTVDAQGYIYEVGVALSASFPTTPGPFSHFSGRTDVFVMKLMPDASAVVWSVLVGGSEDESATAVTVDHVGDIYVTGSTNSPD